MAFIVNSSPSSGLRFEPSITVANERDALDHAMELARRGMRLIRIKDVATGEVFDEKALRERAATRKTNERQ